MLHHRASPRVGAKAGSFRFGSSGERAGASAGVVRPGARSVRFLRWEGLISAAAGGKSAAMMPLLVPAALIVAYRLHPAAVEALCGLAVFWRLWLRWKYY